MGMGGSGSRRERDPGKLPLSGEIVRKINEMSRVTDGP
jgi:hypothetical protein